MPKFSLVSRRIAAPGVRRQRSVRGAAVRQATIAAFVSALLIPHGSIHGQSAPRPRARDVGVVIGVFQPGPLNAITDVAGVRVGQTTVIAGDTIHTGVTAILPHGGNIFRERVPAALFVLNGFGKLLGVTQLQEHGELETPILLTCTLCVWKAADAMVAYLLEQPDMENVRSINPVVGETNDGGLSDIRARPITEGNVRAALTSAAGGAVQEGSVGAGAGTEALGWKGGIGTSSRRLPAAYSSYTVGVLVQTNFGGILTINGAPVGREFGNYAFSKVLAQERGPPGRGSCMVVVATDAPLSPRDLERLAKRAALGLSRTGSFASPGSGDYILAFSTAESVRRRVPAMVPMAPYTVQELYHDDLAPLFEAAVEATEEAVINSLFRATSVTYRGRTVDALPIDRTVQILEKYHVLHWDRTLPPPAP
jgi:D-aminopeptidase